MYRGAPADTLMVDYNYYIMKKKINEINSYYYYYYIE